MLLTDLYEAIGMSKSRYNILNKLNTAKDDFEKFIYDNVNNEPLAISYIIDKLNDLFQYDYDMVFSTGNVPSSEYVATGEIDTQTGDIDIIVDPESFFHGEYSLINNIGLWIATLATTISHELLHREQIKRSSRKISGTNDNSEEKYLANKHEIQAHAKDAVEFIARFSNIKTREDIKNYIKSNINDAKIEITPIKQYWDTFGEDNPAVWKRFLKYLMFYADEFVQLD